VFQYDFSFSGETHGIAIGDEPCIPFIVIASASEAIQGPRKDSALLRRKRSSQ
jgi:hypothetical protein